MQKIIWFCFSNKQDETMRTNAGLKRGCSIFGVFVTSIVLLAGCQTPRQTLPLAYLPVDVVDYKQAEFVENRTLVIQTCLRDRKIDVRTMDISMPNEALPLTVCQRRQSLGQPCSGIWQTSEPTDAATPYTAVRTVRVWAPSGTQQDIAKRWLPISHVKRDPLANSAGGSHEYLKDTTTRGQPVFEYSYEQNARTLFAWAVGVEVLRDGAAQHTTFWFQPPAGLRLNEFTAWRPADAEEPTKAGARSYAIAMANNLDIAQGRVGSGSPYVRFGLLTYRQYNDSERLYRYEFKHAYLKAKQEFPKSQEVQVLRTGAAEIPPC